MTSYRRFLKSFGFTSVRASGIAESLVRRGPGELSDSQRTRLEELADRVRDGHRLNPTEIDEAAEILAHALPRYNVRMLFTGNLKGFRNPQLQTIYLQETASMSPQPDVRNWVSNLSETSQAAKFLRGLCGDDFAAQATSHVGILRPVMLINSVADDTGRLARQPRDELIRIILSAPGGSRQLFDRLQALFNSRRAASQLLAAGTVERAHFSILKGNVAEATARPHVLAAIRDGSPFGQNLPEGAVLINGARVRRGTTSQLFSDGLIGEHIGNRWRWYGIVEVKAYDNGYGDAAEQIVRWRDISGLTTQFTLELQARRATMIRPDGTEVNIENDLSFHFDPANAEASRIELPLGYVNQILIAPQGASRFDLSRTRAQLTGRVFSVSHPYTNKELEYLTAQVIQEVRGAGSIEEALARLELLTDRSTLFRL